MAPAVILRPQRLPPRLPWVCPFRLTTRQVRGASRRTLQHDTIVASPHPAGSKDLPFGLYDILLISVPEGRVLYGVTKEVDIGAVVTALLYASTGLGWISQCTVPTSDGRQGLRRPSRLLALPALCAGPGRLRRRTGDAGRVNSRRASDAAVHP